MSTIVDKDYEPLAIDRYSLEQIQTAITAITALRTGTGTLSAAVRSKATTVAIAVLVGYAETDPLDTVALVLLADIETLLLRNREAKGIAPAGAAPEAPTDAYTRLLAEAETATEPSRGKLLLELAREHRTRSTPTAE